MAGFFDDVPITWAVGADGELHHVDDVPNGKACGCTCPNPFCNQPLMARQGEVNMHHFAHERGSQECKWAVENVVTAIAVDAIRKNRVMVFPTLTYHDYQSGDDRAVIAHAGTVRVSSASLVDVSGRRNPDIAVTCNAGTEKEKTFLAVICLTHPIDEYRSAIRDSGYDAFVVDFRRMLMKMKREDRHFDREAVFARFQDPAFIERVVVRGTGGCMEWVANARSAEATRESRELYEEQARADKERMRIEEERAAAEAARRERQMRLDDESYDVWEVQLAGSPQQRKEERELREREEAERKAREIETRRVDVMERIDQQDEVVLDEFGRRWVRCEICGKVATSDEFTTVGCNGRVNLGKCSDCMGLR